VHVQFEDAIQALLHLPTDFGSPPTPNLSRLHGPTRCSSAFEQKGGRGHLKVVWLLAAPSAMKSFFARSIFLSDLPKAYQFHNPTALCENGKIILTQNSPPKTVRIPAHPSGGGRRQLLHAIGSTDFLIRLWT